MTLNELKKIVDEAVADGYGFCNCGQMVCRDEFGDKVIYDLKSAEVSSWDDQGGAYFEMMFE